MDMVITSNHVLIDIDLPTEEYLSTQTINFFRGGTLATILAKESPLKYHPIHTWHS